MNKDQEGIKNSQWKGHKVGNDALHRWVKNRKPKPKFCRECQQEKKLELANIAPKPNKITYTRDLDNWRYLCRSCHMISDKRILKGWSKKEEEFLVKNYNTIGTKQLSKLIGRTCNAIRLKICKLRNSDISNG